MPSGIIAILQPWRQKPLTKDGTLKCNGPWSSMTSLRGCQPRIACLRLHFLLQEKIKLQSFEATIDLDLFLFICLQPNAFLTFSWHKRIQKIFYILIAIVIITKTKWGIQATSSQMIILWIIPKVNYEINNITLSPNPPTSRNVS